MYKIAFLITRSDQIGGAHIHVRDLAVALQEDGYEVRVFMGGEGRVMTHFRESGLHVLSIPGLKREISPMKDVKAYTAIRDALIDYKPDLFTTHSSKAGILGRLAAWKTETPVMFTVHGWAFTEGKSKSKQWLYRMLEKMVVPITDKIVAVSEYDRELGIKELSLSKDKIIAIHNGMNDIDKSLMADQSECNPVNIVMVARFDHQKDQQELIRASQGISGMHIHFVGDGHLRPDAELLVDELEMRDQVTFHGESNEVDQILSESQIFALISNWEGFPLSTLEGMRAGLPVVVSDVGGSAEAIEQGVTGYAIKKGDLSTLHETLSELVKDYEKRKRMGKAARKKFEECFTFEVMYRETKKVYHHLIEKRGL